MLTALPSHSPRGQMLKSPRRSPRLSPRMQMQPFRSPRKSPRAPRQGGGTVNRRRPRRVGGVLNVDAKEANKSNVQATWTMPSERQRRVLAQAAARGEVKPLRPQRPKHSVLRSPAAPRTPTSELAAHAHATPSPRTRRFFFPTPSPAASGKQHTGTFSDTSPHGGSEGKHGDIEDSKSSQDRAQQGRAAVPKLRLQKPPENSKQPRVRTAGASTASSSRGSTSSLESGQDGEKKRRRRRRKGLASREPSREMLEAAQAMQSPRLAGPTLTDYMSGGLFQRVPREERKFSEASSDSKLQDGDDEEAGIASVPRPRGEAARLSNARPLNVVPNRRASLRGLYKVMAVNKGAEMDGRPSSSRGGRRGGVKELPPASGGMLPPKARRRKESDEESKGGGDSAQPPQQPKVHARVNLKPLSMDFNPGMIRQSPLTAKPRIAAGFSSALPPLAGGLRRTVRSPTDDRRDGHLGAVRASHSVIVSQTLRADMLPGRADAVPPLRRKVRKSASQTSVRHSQPSPLVPLDDSPYAEGTPRQAEAVLRAPTPQSGARSLQPMR